MNYRPEALVMGIHELMSKNRPSRALQMRTLCNLATQNCDRDGQCVKTEWSAPARLRSQCPGRQSRPDPDRRRYCGDGGAAEEPEAPRGVQRREQVPAGPAFELLASNDLDDYTLSSPAVSEGQIFIRTQKHLYCIGKRVRRRKWG